MSVRCPAEWWRRKELRLHPSRPALFIIARGWLKFKTFIASLVVSGDVVGDTPSVLRCERTLTLRLSVRWRVDGVPDFHDIRDCVGKLFFEFLEILRVHQVDVSFRFACQRARRRSSARASQGTAMRILFVHYCGIL